MTPDSIDIGLARRVAAGDAGAFEPVVRRHGRLLFRTARSILHDDAEAEDCVRPWSYRSVFMLRAVDQLSVRQTAQALGISEETVRTRFFRARGLLREGLPCA